MALRKRCILSASVLAASSLAIAASQASAACYFAGGSCAFGSMASNSPSAWTGNYTSDFNYMRVADGQRNVFMTVQIRPYTGASGYSWSSSFATSEYGRGYPSGSWQHRCYHGGPSSPVSVRCSFS